MKAGQMSYMKCPKKIGSSPIKFESTYKWFEGTIYPGVDCGEKVCGKSACCFPHFNGGKPSYIYYLPGELEFLRIKLGKKFPARETEPNTGKFHCYGDRDQYGSKRCNYDYRPIDCRSYPYWPVVKDEKLLGFLDLRQPRCNIKRIRKPFFEKMKSNWIKLLENPTIRDWLENEAPKPRGKFIPINQNIRRDK